MKSADPSAVCVSRVGGAVSQVARAPFGAWQMAGAVDVWGASDYQVDLFKSALLRNAMLSSKKSSLKTWWLSEQAGGRTWTLFRDRHRTPEFVVGKMILAMSYGCSGNVIWQWRNESFGLESPNFGIVFEDGTSTARLARVAQLARAPERHSEVFEGMRLDEPDVGLVSDWRLRVFEYAAFKEAGRFSEPEVLGWHKALTILSANVEILGLEDVVSGGVPPPIKLFIIPLLIQEVPGLYERLLDLVSGGGTLVVGPYFLVYDEGRFANYEVPPQEYQGLLGFKRREIYYPGEVSISVITERGALTLKGHHLVEEFELVGGAPIAHFKDVVCGARRDCGSGRPYSFGTLLGTPSVEDPRGLAELLPAMLEAAGCRRFPPATSGAVTRLARSLRRPALRL